MVVVRMSIMLVVWITTVAVYVLNFSDGSAWLYQLKKNDKAKRFINKFSEASTYIILGGFTTLAFIMPWLYVFLFVIWLMTLVMCYFYVKRGKKIPISYAIGNAIITLFLLWTIAENFIQTLGNF